MSCERYTVNSRSGGGIPVVLGVQRGGGMHTEARDLVGRVENAGDRDQSVDIEGLASRGYRRSGSNAWKNGSSVEGGLRRGRRSGVGHTGREAV